VNGSHDNAIRGDQFAADKVYAIGSGGNGFFADPCTHANQPFSPVEARWATATRSPASATSQPTSPAWSLSSHASSRQPSGHHLLGEQGLQPYPWRRRGCAQEPDVDVSGGQRDELSPKLR